MSAFETDGEKELASSRWSRDFGGKEIRYDRIAQLRADFRGLLIFQ